jgi:hypothetical protein
MLLGQVASASDMTSMSSPTEKENTKVTIGPDPNTDLIPKGLFLTEINANDINRNSTYGSGSNDIMEYVEIANTTDTDIDFNEEYVLKYDYLSGTEKKEKDLIISSFDGSEVMVPAKGCAVFWIYREGQTSYDTFPTVDEFRVAYDIPTQIPIYKVVGQNGLSNDDRGISLYHQQECVSNYWWRDGVDVSDGKSVQLRVNYQSSTMLPYKRKAALSAGVYDIHQVTYIPDYGVTPTLILEDDSIISINEGEQLFISYKFDDKLPVNKISAFYKTSKDETYSEIPTTSYAVANKYYMMIPSDKLLNCDYVDYYVTAYDIYRSTTTQVRRIKINRTDASTGIYLNIADQDNVKDKVQLVACDSQHKGALNISVDGKKLETTPTLEKCAFFTFDYTGVDACYKNGLTTGNTIIKNFAKCNTVLSDSSMAIVVDRKYFTYNEDGTAKIELTLRAGTWGSTWENNTPANNDEYSVTNLTLQLTNGTILHPTNIDYSNIYKLGDAAGCTTELMMTFNLPAEALTAQVSNLDTTKLSDGKHTIQVTDSYGDKVSISINVDNRPTVIASNPTDVIASDARKIPDTKGINQTTQKNDYQWDGTGIPEQYDFSVAWITDTQYYSEAWPNNYLSITNWIAKKMKDLKMVYTIHTGDIVDDFNETFEWKNADVAMKVLEDVGMPYGVLGGNHDVAHGNQFYTNYWKYFGEKRFTNSPVYGGSYKNNLGHYDLLSDNGKGLIFIYMSWDIYTDEINWMNSVLEQYPERTAIICVHGGIDSDAKESYTGNLLLEDVCKTHKNVMAILNGHYHGGAINTVGFDDDGDGVKERCVYQICTDYQAAKQGGLGYVKMLYFDLANGKIYMNSYSPILDDYNYFDKPKLEGYGIGTVASDLDIYELNSQFK